jgi:hypothetical protein
LNMNSSEQSMGVAEAERAFLRKGWWLFPLLGWLASAALDAPYWRWVGGESPLPLNWGALLGLKGMALAAAGGCIPLAWRLGLAWRARRGWVVGLALMVVLAVDAVWRGVPMQAFTWLAARPRLEGHQHFMREVCYVRLEEAVGRADPASAIVLVGSSQVLVGVDEKLLRELVQPVPVIRRAMFGMSPLKALAMMPYMPYRSGDVSFHNLSEFDFTNKEEFPHDWFRPYASWRTLPAVLACMEPRVRRKHWGRTVDYAMAATLELWRDRDFLRQIAFNFWGIEKDEVIETDEAARAKVVARARGNLSFAAAEKRAFHAFAERLEREGVRMLIFEGDVRPDLHDEDRLEARRLVREELREWAAAGPHRHVSLEEQGLNLGMEHWRDMTHLSESGRRLLTLRIAEKWSGGAD